MARPHDSLARTKLLDWINETLAAKQWKPYNWTLKAGLSDTSLTRFLSNPTTAPLPSATTIVALATAADSNPILVNAKKLPVGRNLPLLNGKLLTQKVSCATHMDAQTIEQEIEQSTDRRVPIVNYAASDKAYAVEVETRSMNAAGLLPGDHLVVEPPEVCPPRLGDTVVILTCGGRICPMKVQTPWLVPVSTCDDIPPVLAEETQVLGVVMQMSRPLRREVAASNLANGKEGLRKVQ